MGIHFELDLTPEQFATAANDQLAGGDFDYLVFRMIILMTPEYRLAEQAENPLRIDAERVALAIEAYRDGAEPGINTHFHGWVQA